MENLASRIHRIQPSATLEMTAKAADLKRKGLPVFNMSVGEPDMPTPAIYKKQEYMQLKMGIPDILLGEELTNSKNLFKTNFKEIII